MAALCCLFLPTMAQAVELRVHSELHGAPAATNAAKLRFQSLSTQQIVEVMLPLEGGSIDIPAGQWSLDVDNPEWWHARQYLRVPETPVEVVMPLWRSAFVQGGAALRDGSIPKNVTVRFASSPEPLQGESTCPVVEKRFRCRIAAGLLDMRLRSRGCIAHYYWGSSVAPGAALDLGQMVFDRGAAITGSVRIGRGLRTPLPALRVRAAPDGSAHEKSGLLQLVAAPGPRGFFHIDGVPPGQYVVRVEGSSRVASTPVRVTVAGDVEAQLREPLVADLPRMLTVDVLPARDSEQRPWIVTLDREVTRRYSETVSQGAVDRDGVWRARIQPGQYTVRLSSIDGSVWAVRDVEIEADTHVPLTVSTRTVHGKVLLGRKPLAATLTFGGEFGSPRVPVKSNEEGRFDVQLPNPDVVAWDVTVDASAPRVKRTVRATLAADKDLVLELRDTVVFGTVVDETGTRVGREVGVNLTHGEELIQVGVEADGSFAFHGVDPGACTLQADGYLLQSDAVEITVPEDGAPDEMHLVVRHVREVLGRVVSDLGPVAGAQVTVVPVDVPFVTASNRETDARGEFSTTAPPNCQRVDVFVAAPGFSYKAFRTTLRDGSALNIHVDQRGGSLTARWPARSPAPLLFHAGAMIWPDSLVWAWNGHRQTQKDVEELVSAPLDPGVYTLCASADAQKPRSAPDARCVDAFLPPFGEVVLERN